MGLTEPAAFTKYKYKGGAVTKVVIMCDDGTTKHFFGNYEGDILYAGGTEYHIYNKLDDGWSVSVNVDVFRKSWSRVEFSFTLNNMAPYRLDTDGTVILPSEALADFLQRDNVKLWLTNDPNPTDTDDMLLYFDGVLASQPSYDQFILQCRCVDHLNLYKRKIPYTTIGEIDGTAPDELQDQIAPVPFGLFAYVEGSPSTTTGVSPGVPIDSTVAADPPTYCFSTEQCAAGGSMYGVVSSKWLELYAPDNSTIDNGATGCFGTHDADSDGGYRATRYYSVNNTVSSGLYQNRTDCPITNPTNAYDDNYTTVATIKDNISDNTTAMQCFGAWGIDNESDIRRLLIEGTPIIPQFKNLYFETAAGGTSNIKIGLLFKYYSNLSSYFYRFVNVDSHLSSSAWLDAVYVNIGEYGGDDEQSGIASRNFANEDFPYPIHLILYAADTNSHGDGATNNQNLISVGELRLKARVPVLSWQELGITGYWWTGTGVVLSSLYTGADNQYAASMIWWILKNFCAVPTAFLVEANFTGVTNDNCRLSLGAHNSGDSESIIRQLVEQQRFIFTINTVSQPVLVSMINKTPTADLLVHYSQIAQDSLKVSKSEWFINKLVVFSRWHEHTGSFIDRTEYDQSGAGNEYVYTANWKSVLGTERGNVASHYVNATDGLWNHYHTIVDLEVLGLIASDLQPGDHIELDTDVDPHIKNYGASWSGSVMMVYDIVQTQTSTKIKAIELY